MVGKFIDVIRSQRRMTKVKTIQIVTNRLLSHAKKRSEILRLKRNSIVSFRR